MMRSLPLLIEELKCNKKSQSRNPIFLFDKRGEDVCSGVSRGEVNGGGVVLGVFKRRLKEIPGEVIEERGGDTIGLDGGAICYSVGGDKF
ncbi:hypothetical protein Tco_0492010 [Tanacetum coccineum]